MRDFETKPSKDKGFKEGSKTKPNKVRRIFGGTVVAGLAAVALAIGLRGGNGEYDQATKDSLKASLRPTAVKIARGAIKHTTGWDRFKEGNKVIVNIHDAAPPLDREARYPYTPIDIGVVTGITNGRADPRKVQSLSISRGNPFGNIRTVYINSPSSATPDSFFSDGRDYSGHGAWSGSVIDLNGRFMERRGFQTNTDNAFVASDNLDIFDPELDARIQTAETVADMAENIYDRLYGQRADILPPQQPR
ncbi:MAG: hypothetical protein WD885_03385 [Candidatus Saccharimonadales bacterium]